MTDDHNESDQDSLLGLRIGTAQRGGTREVCCDALAVYRFPVADLVATCVVDGIGSSAQIAGVMGTAAEVAARIGARRGVYAGLAAAGELVSRPSMKGRHFVGPDDADGAAVLALVRPGDITSVSWLGDCRAWGWDGSALTQWTTDQVMGQWVRIHGGVPVEVAEHHDDWLRTSLATASAATIRQVEIPAGVMVVLTSDGIHKPLPAKEIEDLVRTYADDPQALADALAVAPQPDDSGYRDDATAVVVAAAAA